MDGKPNGDGKILQHASGLGVPTPELVRRRARELAVINGRQPADYTDADWQQAKRELHGGHDFLHGEQAPETAELGLLEENDHRAVRHWTSGADNLGEELFAEGMDEAVHEQMLEARRAADADDA